MKRGRFCSRCGSPQPRRIGQALVGLAMLGGLTVGTIRAFLSVEGGGAEFNVPAPSGGTWDGDEYMGEGEVRDNEPSIFMTASGSSTDPSSTGTN